MRVKHKPQMIAIFSEGEMEHSMDCSTSQVGRRNSGAGTTTTSLLCEKANYMKV